MIADLPQSDIDGRYAWARLTISVVLATLGCAGMWAVVVVLPAVQTEFGVDRADASFPYTATMIGFAVGNVVVGRAVDRYGYWMPALACAVAMGAGMMLASLANSIEVFSALHVLVGLGCAAMFGPLIADVSHWFVRRRGVAVTAAASGNYIAGALWPAIMPWLLTPFGWRATYFGIGAVCLAGMIPLVLMLRRSADHEASAAAQTASVQRRQLTLTPRQLQGLLILAGFGCCMAMSMPQVHIVAYCMDLGFGVARGAEMLAIMLAGGVVSRIASGFLADRIGGIRTLLIGSVLQCLALAAYIPFDGLASLYVVSLVFGLSQGGIVPCYAIIVREYLPAREAGQRIGFVMMATILGMAVGGWTTGLIFDWTNSYAMAFLNGIAWNLVNVGVMVLVLFNDRGERATARAATSRLSSSG